MKMDFSLEFECGFSSKCEKSYKSASNSFHFSEIYASNSSFENPIELL